MKYHIEDYTFFECLRISLCCILMAFAMAIMPENTVDLLKNQIFVEK